MMNEKIITGLTALIVALIGGSVLSRLHGNGDRINHIGDRVFLGLLSIPLIPILVHFISPSLNPCLKFLSTGPVWVYVSLLAKEDWKTKSNDRSPFTRNLFIGITAIYLIIVVVAFATNSFDIVK